MAFLIVYLILAVVFAFIGSEMAKSRNRDAAAWALICALIPLLGVVALAVAGNAQAHTTYTPAARIEDSLTRPKASVKADTKPYDIKKWEALLEVDDDVAKAAQEITPYGPSYVDDFAEKYLALGDKAYLEVLRAKMIAKAVKDREISEEQERQNQIDKAKGDNKIYFQYIEKLKENGGIDPDYNQKVLRVQRYTGLAKPFRNGVEVEFEDGTFALKGGFLMRRFDSRTEMEKWGS
jgi:hypothetical protein